MCTVCLSEFCRLRYYYNLQKSHKHTALYKTLLFPGKSECWKALLLESVPEIFPLSSNFDGKSFQNFSDSLIHWLKGYLPNPRHYCSDNRALMGLFPTLSSFSAKVLGITASNLKQ